MRLSLTTLALLLSAMLFAQAPALIPYQAIARDGAGQPLASSTLNARFTLHDIAATGTVVWQELQTVSTSALGLFTAQLGSSVSLANVNWAAGAKFMQVELDLGNGFVDIGTQQLLSVPYALYAGSVQLNVSETGDTLFVGEGSFVVVPGISEANITNGGGETTTGSTLHTCGAQNVHNPNLTYGSMTDQEGNVYKTIVIGTQEWMAENLNTSIYRNGDAIPTGLSNDEWTNTINTQQGAWAYYNNDASYACPYGKLYNWYACVDPRGLCPTGWHVPSDEEWSVLVKYLDPAADTTCLLCSQSAIAGGMMKSIGTIEAVTGLWNSPNEGATNSSGFSGLPGGYRNYFGDYYYMGTNGYWWSSTEDGPNGAWNRYLVYNDPLVGRWMNSTPDGWGVRCLRD